MPYYENGDVRIYYEDTGEGFPILVIPGGGLNATIASLGHAGSFDPRQECGDGYRYITMDLRNANGGRSEGPLEIDRPWDSFADDQLGVMDHLGIDRFMTIGFCIGAPFTWNLIRRAPDRIVASVLAHPSGFNPKDPDVYFNNNMRVWGPALIESRGDVDMAQVEAFLESMYRNRGDFLFTVDRDFVRNCQTPILVMPDDIPAHPYETAMESALLSPNAEISLFPWRTPEERIPIAVRHVRSFLKAHCPATVAAAHAAAE